jgi:hypothetical protein
MRCEFCASFHILINFLCDETCARVNSTAYWLASITRQQADTRTIIINITEARSGTVSIPLLKLACSKKTGI